MSRFAILASTAIVALTAAVPTAFAQTAEEAATIRAIIASAIESLGDGREVKGDIAVVPGTGRYDVSIPELEIATFRTGRPSTLTIAPFSGTITPAADDIYTVAFTLPSTVTRRELDRDPAVATGAGMLSVTFSAASGIPSALALTLDGLDLSIPDKGEIRLGSFAVKARTVDSALGPSLDDLLIAIGAKALQITDDDQQGVLGSARLEISASGLDVPGIVSAAQRVQALFLAAKSASASELDAVLTEAMQAFGQLPKLIDGFHLGYAIEGVDFPAAHRQTLVIGSTDFGLDISGLSGDATSVAVTAGLAGLDAPVSDPVYQPYLPQHVALDIALTGIPNGLIAATVSGAVNAAAVTGADDPGEALLQSLATVLLTSDLALEVRTLEVGSSAASLSATASAGPDPASPFMAGGAATIVVGGFERAIATASEMEDGLKAAQGLTVIQALGRPETDAEGNPVRRYEIAVGSDGRIMVNGTDIAPLIAGR
jgi:hypothetical protein